MARLPSEVKIRTKLSYFLLSALSIYIFPYCLYQGIKLIKYIKYRIHIYYFIYTEILTIRHANCIYFRIFNWKPRSYTSNILQSEKTYLTSSSTYANIQLQTVWKQVCINQYMINNGYYHCTTLHKWCRLQNSLRCSILKNLLKINIAPDIRAMHSTVYGQ